MSRPGNRQRSLWASWSALLLMTGCTAGHADGTPLDPADVVSAGEAQALAESMGIDDPPVVTPIRVIRLDEWAETQIECLREAGYDVTFTADGEGVRFPPLDEAVTRTRVPAPMSPS